MHGSPDTWYPLSIIQALWGGQGKGYHLHFTARDTEVQRDASSAIVILGPVQGHTAFQGQNLGPNVAFSLLEVLGYFHASRSHGVIADEVL